MRIGASLLLIAVGAILTFAVADHLNGVNLGVVGIILMVVGAAGLILEAVFASRRRHQVVVHEQSYAQPPAGPARY